MLTLLGVGAILLAIVGVNTWLHLESVKEVYEKMRLAKEEEITLVIQVNGKLRDKVLVPASIDETEAKELALGRERVKAYVGGKSLTRIIYAPKRVVNIVVAS